MKYSPGPLMRKESSMSLRFSAQSRMEKKEPKFLAREHFARGRSTQSIRGNGAGQFEGRGPCTQFQMDERAFLSKKGHSHLISLDFCQLDGIPGALHSNILTTNVTGGMRWTVSISIITGRGTFLMATSQLRGFTLFTVSTALCVVAMATLRLGGLGVIARIATLANSLAHLGFLLLFAGCRIHILRGRIVRWASTLITVGFGDAKSS